MKEKRPKKADGSLDRIIPLLLAEMKKHKMYEGTITMRNMGKYENADLKIVLTRKP